MAQQLCPACGCVIASGYEEKGVVYCCEPCATVSACVYGCCEVVKEPRKEKK